MLLLPTHLILGQIEQPGVGLGAGQQEVPHLVEDDGRVGGRPRGRGVQVYLTAPGPGTWPAQSITTLHYCSFAHAWWQL